MTAQTVLLPGTVEPRSDGPRNLIGGRKLVAVQTFDVARLTTHAVPIVPGTFIAVSGVGPKGDSNGSGKTSFLAAVTVLLADPQWRLDVNGGQLAAGLLFKPDAAGLDASRFSAAPHGHVVGVFANPNDPTGATDTLLTVWIRLYEALLPLAEVFDVLAIAPVERPIRSTMRILPVRCGSGPSGALAWRPTSSWRTTCASMSCEWSGLAEFLVGQPCPLHVHGVGEFGSSRVHLTVLASFARRDRAVTGPGDARRSSVASHGRPLR